MARALLTEHDAAIYHHLLAHSIGEAMHQVILACEVYSRVEMKNHVEFL